jgi:hypothetical protein
MERQNQDIDCIRRRGKSAILLDPFSAVSVLAWRSRFPKTGRYVFLFGSGNCSGQAQEEMKNG